MPLVRILCSKPHLHRAVMGLVLSSLPVSLTNARSPEQVAFDEQIKPVLQECAACHGGVKQTSGLSVLSRERLLSETDSGVPAVVPGDPEASELFLRVSSDDPDLRMPPEAALEAHQVAALEDWIARGAPWPEHWAYTPLPETPIAAEQTPPGVLPIDALIERGRGDSAATPMPAADRRTLIRRLSIDLTGLLPTPPEVAAFLADEREDAYERLVDRLLASPHFGERWARHWLDEARYADSEGYEKDTPKADAYQYRDWVIEAINADMPFDQFTIKQIAGDLLPDRTAKDLLATKLHLQAQFNLEGGVDAEEDRTKRVIDRVNTISMVWLATTIGCCQCHDHPYDPLSQRDFYGMYAFFNNADLAADFLIEPPENAEELRAERAKQWAETAELIRRQVDDKNLSQAVQGQLSKLRPYDNSKGFTRFLRERQEDRRTTYVFRRGNFLEPLVEEGPVLPDTPETLPPLMPRGEAADRLDLARWLVDPNNPLTARVTVNKIWMHLFGEPLTMPGDFGSRGEEPVLRELLDEMARWFREEGAWSRKALIRQIVLSDAYQQQSKIRPVQAEIDPANALLYRQNRYRVEAELVRDFALQVAGLLSRKVGGPSVFPPLPAIIAEQTYAGSNKYKASEGEDRFRRGLYTFARRTAMDPNLLVFDCPEGAQSRAERYRSNNALQALATLQNEVFHEAAQAFAARLLKLSFGASLDDDARFREAFMIALSRPPSKAELLAMSELLAAARSYYEHHPDDAEKLVGTHRVVDVSVVENAAWVASARAILNLDEFLTRE